MQPSDGISRRGLLRLGAGVAWTALGAQLLAACSPAAPAGNAGTSGAAGASSGSTSRGPVQLPTSVPMANLPQPDLPGTPDGLVMPGYLRYPANLVRSVPQPPGHGGEVNALTVSLSPAPTPLDQNAAWQQVNRELGVTLKVPSISTVDYPTRLSTTVAGSDLPDLIAAAILATTLANLADFLDSACADLTPYLSGDAVKAYPNLANLPTSAWLPSVFNNKIMAVPVASGGIRSNAPILFARWGDLDSAGITGINSLDEFTGIARQLNNPSGNRWALGANKFVNWMTQVFGGPNNWRESGGKFTKDWETPEFKDAVAYHRSLWDAGLFHPDSAALSGSPAGAQFYAGRYVFSAYASWSSYQTTWDRATAADPNFKPRAVLPFSKDGHGRAPQFLGSGGTGIVALKKAPAERIKELLGILNYLAAPMGTTEQLLLQYGVEGAEFTRDASGNPVPTPQAAQDMAVPWKYVGAPPDFLFSATSADYVTVAHQTQTEHFAVTLADPSVGLYSPTDGSKGAILRTTFTDGLAEILFGKRPVSGLDDLVKDWRSNGGDRTRAEYEQAFQASKG
ncbi:MAG TPA: extracellular solute-binding protein [Chloroflexota bacterium]